METPDSGRSASEVSTGAGRALIGREAHLEAARAMIERPPRSTTLFLIEGEPGIGKTVILHELARIADGSGLLVLEGRATELERNVPFAVFLDALDDYLGSLNERVIEPADADGRGELARIFPSLSGLAGEVAVPAQEERYRAHSAVRSMLGGLAARRPLLLVLDDLHWADEASVELLSHLVRHPGDRPVVLAGAVRSGQTPPRLAKALAEIAAERRLERIEPAPLSESEARELIGAEVDERLARELHRDSGGNPFYLEQLLREAGDRATGSTAPPRSAARTAGVGAMVADVPAPVIASIEREIDLLAPDEVALARGAAVVGEGFDPDLAAAAGDLDRGRALACLDVLLERDLVRTTDVPRRFRFRHPIVRHAVYAGAPPGWLLAAHGRAAAALDRPGVATAARAHHVERSAGPGDEAAIALLTKTADGVAPGAPAAAAHWLAAAIRLLPEGDHGRRLGMLVPMARALAASGHFTESLAAIDEVLILLPEDQPALRGRVIASAARIDHLRGVHGGKRTAEVRAVLEQLPDQSSADATALKLELASDCFFGGELEQFERWVRAACEDAHARNDRPGIAAGVGLLSTALYMRDETEAARAELGRALALIEELSDIETAEHLNSFTWVGLGAITLERFGDGIELLDRTIRVAQATEQGHLPALMRINQAYACLWTGRAEQAAVLLDSAVETSILTANPIFLAWAQSLQSWEALLRGALPEAVRLAEESAGGAVSEADPITATAACHLAEALLAAGRVDQAAAALLSNAGGPELTMVERSFRPRPYETLTRIAIAREDLTAAGEWASRAEQAAAGLGIRGRDADALRATATVALARGDADVAREAALASAAAADEVGMPIEAARGRLLAARAPIDGDRDAAIAALRAVHAELEGLGAVLYRDEAASELRGLGVRVARSGTRGGSGDSPLLAELTAREREIAALVADGRRNREIAESLFLSVRTVEGHLGRIFRKLDVDSRTRLAALVRKR